MTRPWHAKDSPDEAPSRQVIVASSGQRPLGGDATQRAKRSTTVPRNTGPSATRRTSVLEAAERCVATDQVVAERQFGGRSA